MKKEVWMPGQCLEEGRGLEDTDGDDSQLPCPLSVRLPGPNYTGAFHGELTADRHMGLLWQLGYHTPHPGWSCVRQVPHGGILPHKTSVPQPGTGFTEEPAPHLAKLPPSLVTAPPTSHPHPTPRPSRLDLAVCFYPARVYCIVKPLQ